jgi:hypothetical protein
VREQLQSCSFTVPLLMPSICLFDRAVLTDLMDQPTDHRCAVKRDPSNRAKSPQIAAALSAEGNRDLNCGIMPRTMNSEEFDLHF